MKTPPKALLTLIIAVCLSPLGSKAIDLSSCRTAADSIEALIPYRDASRYCYSTFCSAYEKSLYELAIKSYYDFPGGSTNRLYIYPSQNGIANPARALCDTLAARIRFDVPEFYILTSYTARNMTRGEYYWNLYMLYTPSKLASELAEMRNKVEPLIAATAGMTEYEKALYLHDEFLKMTRYGGMSSAYSGDIKGCLIEGAGVCQGWARTYQYLCQLAGLTCLYIEGALNQTPDEEEATWITHAFNYIRIDGKWYFTDCTSDGGLGGVGHLYFLKGQKTFDKGFTLGYGGPTNANSNLMPFDNMPTLEEYGYGESATTEPETPTNTYTVVHGANEESYHDTHYPHFVSIVGEQSPEQKLNNIATEAPCACYFDKHTTVFDVKAGDVVNADISINGNWMHGYVFVDWNNDGQFNVNLSGSGPYTSGADSELMAYSFYNAASSSASYGWNSAGKYVTSNTSLAVTPGSFQIPADLPVGSTYRMRYMVAWNCIDPTGNYKYFLSDGAFIIDVTLRISGVVEEPEEIHDITKDGAEDDQDLQALHLIVTYGLTSTPFYDLTAADVNGDGHVSIADITALVNRLYGKK